MIKKLLGPKIVQQSARKKHRPRWKLFIVLMLVAGLVYWLFFSGGSDKDHKKTDIPVNVAVAMRKNIPVYLTGLGTVQAYNTVTVHTQVDGKLMEVLFREGQNVHKGDILARIDSRIFQAQYDQTVANKAKDAALLENANRDLKRYISIGKSVSDQTRDTQRSLVRQLEAAVAGDQAAIDNAKTQLSYTTVQAPINGRTGIRQVDVGNIVHPGDTNGIVVLTQLQPISVVFSLPQQNLAMVNEQINAGKTLMLDAMDADNKTPIDSGALELIDNQIDQNTGTIKLKSTFPNSKNTLWPGGFVNVRLLVTIRENATVIPVAAIQRGPQNFYVFVYKPEDNSVTIRPVKVAMNEGQDAVIDEGIQEGEQVVTDGMAKLQDGSHVTIDSGEKPAAQPVGDKNDDSRKETKHHQKGS